MITPEEIGEVAIFSSLASTDKERLSRAAADISLIAGEFAAQEGDERALFAVLDGRIEAVKATDGIERAVGERQPGDVFGEVPIVLGTVFPVGFRAAEPTRVMRIDPAAYHSLSAVAPDVAREIGRLAAHRMGGTHGLQGLAADPPPPRAIIVGHRWDPDCAALRRFLDYNQVTYRWITGEAPEESKAWEGALPDNDDLPAIRAVDGKTAVRPSLRRVAELLGMNTEPAEAIYDTVIVGAGPAGLAAAVYGASEGLRTIVVEREAPGGQAGTSSRIENYLGFPSGVSGDELASRALQQARRLGAEILVTRSITRIDPQSRELHLDGGDVLRARTIILACGVTWRQLEIEGLDQLAGKGVSYGAARSEAPNVHGLDVHVIGAGNSAGQAALFFSTYARNVTILCRGDRLEKSMSRYLIDQLASRENIDVAFGVEVAAVQGGESLAGIDLRQIASGEVTAVDSSGLFIFIGADAETEWLPATIDLDRHGYVLTGAEMRAASSWNLDRDPFLLETSVPGISACGDVRSGPVKRVAAAVGEGSMSIAFVHQYLRELEPTDASASAPA